MIQKFANSERNAGFCHVSRACACSFEIRHSIVRCRNFRPAIREKKPTHTIVYFWLSENGSSKPILHFTMKTGLSVHASTSGVGPAIGLMPVPCTAIGAPMSFESSTRQTGGLR